MVKLDSLEVSPSWNKPRAVGGGFVMWKVDVNCRGVQLYGSVKATPKTTIKKLTRALDDISQSELLYENYEPISNELAKRGNIPLKCIIGEWKKIYSPSLKGTAFKQAYSVL